MSPRCRSFWRIIACVGLVACKQFCDDATVEKQCATKEASEDVDTLKADSRKYEVDAEQLTRKGSAR